MTWKDRWGGSTGQRVAGGANFIVYTLVGIAIVVLANWFVSNHDHRWDLTPSKRYSLSPQSQKLLKELNRDVKIYVFDRERSFGERRDLLGMFAAASRRVDVQYVDPDRQPQLARQYGVRTFGTIVVAAGERHYEATGDSEEGVTNALIRVLKGQRSACFIQGHGERNLDSSEPDGFDRVKKALENENYQTQSVVLMQKMEIPASCALLVVAGPQNDYLPPEVDTLKKWIGDGGRAFFLLDPGVELPNLSKLLADWNVTLHNDLVIDLNPVAQVFGTGPELPLVMKYGSSPIVQPLTNRMTLFPLARSFDLGKDYKAGVTADSLCESSADSFGVAGWNPKIQKISYRAGKDEKGPLKVAVSGTVSGPAEKKEGRFVALGTSLLAANRYLGFQANRDFFMNTINWLSADEDLISVRPKPQDSQHLDMNARQMRGLLLGGVLGLPLLIIVAGTLVWWQRR